MIAVVERSKLYSTEPVGGPTGQSDYTNAACLVQTTLSARELLDVCLSIEQQFGRKRGVRWGPRTLDIDLLLYGDRIVSEPGLQLPHPRLQERLFVLVPLSDVAQKDLALGPDGATLQEVLRIALESADETIEDWRYRVTD